MLARYVAGLTTDAVLDPDGAPWSGVRAESVAMIQTPLGLQPTPAVQVSWAGKEFGTLDRVQVSAIHDGSRLAFRLEWKDPTENRELIDTTAFVDGAAVLLPAKPDTPMPTMGAEGLPVTAWYWRADEPDSGRHVVAAGLGTTRTLESGVVQGRGTWKNGGWRVVLVRALRIQTTEPVVQLDPATPSQFGVAVWEGSRGERAGIKSFSGDWRELKLASAPRARR